MCYIVTLLVTLQDWENVARDLQTLGFIPADAGDPVAMGMAEPLGKILYLYIRSAILRSNHDLVCWCASP
jgi:hypothetical protein